MFYLCCPYCQEHRDESEFVAIDQAHLSRPKSPENEDDAAWARYLFYRDNRLGLQHELWLHAHGCGRYFNLTRDTRSYAIVETYALGARPKVQACASYAVQHRSSALEESLS